MSEPTEADWLEGNDPRTTQDRMGDGCYICQPENPNAAEEGCEDCDRGFWQWVTRVNTAPTKGDDHE